MLFKPRRAKSEATMRAMGRRIGGLMFQPRYSAAGLISFLFLFLAATISVNAMKPAIFDCRRRRCAALRLPSGAHDGDGPPLELV